jgi:hypothetical protein
MSANTKITQRFERSSRTWTQIATGEKCYARHAEQRHYKRNQRRVREETPKPAPAENGERHLRQDRELPSISLTVDTSHTISQGSPEGEYTQRFSSTAIMDRGILLGARWQLGSDSVFSWGAKNAFGKRTARRI